MLWLILWLVAGFSMFLLWCAEDMRGADYEYDVMHESGLYLLGCILITALGPASLFVYVVIRILENDLFAKLIYRIVNIGVKKEEESASDV